MDSIAHMRVWPKRRIWVIMWGLSATCAIAAIITIHYELHELVVTILLGEALLLFLFPFGFMLRISEDGVHQRVFLLHYFVAWEDIVEVDQESLHVQRGQLLLQNSGRYIENAIISRIGKPKLNLTWFVDDWHNSELVDELERRIRQPFISA